MSDIRFECPKCKRHLIGDEQLTLQTIDCPDCGHKFSPTIKTTPEKSQLEILQQLKAGLDSGEIKFKAKVTFVK
jgi:DNA-directed RNA polymerase subunit RPC12/RpoP